MLLCGLIWGKNKEKTIIPKTLACISEDFLYRTGKCRYTLVTITIAGTIVFQPDKFRGLIAF